MSGVPSTAVPALSVHSHLHSFLPTDPQVPPGEEASYCMPGQVMDPPLLPQLSHDGVYPGKSCLCLRPLGKCLGIFFPGYADADRVPLHLVKAWVVGCCGVEELPPQQLAIQGEWRGAVLFYLGQKKQQE